MIQVGSLGAFGYPLPKTGVGRTAFTEDDSASRAQAVALEQGQEFEELKPAQQNRRNCCAGNALYVLEGRILGNRFEKQDIF